MGQQNRIVISLKQSLLYSWGQNENWSRLKLIKQEQGARNTDLYGSWKGRVLGGFEGKGGETVKQTCFHVTLCGKQQIKPTKS